MVDWPVFKNLIRWGKKWFLSDSMAKAIRYRRYPSKLQKFWMGRPTLPAPSAEKSYFDQAHLESSIVRRIDDYRAAAVVKKEAELSLSHLHGHQAVQFAVTPVDDYNGGIGPIIKFKLGTQETCIKDIPHGKWYDVRLDFDGTVDRLIVETDKPMAMTMPRGVVCSPAVKSPKRARHVIVLVLDAWTSAVADRAHPFTGEATSIPNIERFFDDGIKAPHGVSNGQWTLPSVGSLFTGQHIARHQMFHPVRWQEFDQNRKTLPEYFQEQGYHTQCGSVVSRVTPAFGHSRGFDRFLYHFVDPQLSDQVYNPAQWIQEIIGHLEAHHNDSTFSYFQFPDTHPSWHLAPDTRYFHLGRRGNTSTDLKKMMMSFPHDEDLDLPEQAVQLYLLRLAELDRIFGCFFDYVNRHFGDEAIVAVTADHGLRMPYLSEAYKDDEPFLTDIRVNIPFYIRGKGVSPKIHEKLCSPNIDLPVMLLELAGIKPDGVDFDGINFCHDQKQRDQVISEYIYNGVYEIAVRGEGHALFLKYAMDDVTFKFLSPDPTYIGLYPLGEEKYLPEHNLIDHKPEVAQKLKAVAQSHFIKTGIVKKDAYEQEISLHDRAIVV